MKIKKQKINYTTIGVRLINTEKPTTKIYTYLAPLKHGLVRGDYVAVPARGVPMLGIIIRTDKTPHFDDNAGGITYVSVIGKVQEITPIESVGDDEVNYDDQ